MKEMTKEIMKYRRNLKGVEDEYTLSSAIDPPFSGKVVRPSVWGHNRLVAVKEQVKI